MWGQHDPFLTLPEGISGDQVLAAREDRLPVTLERRAGRLGGELRYPSSP